ncbi:MAG: aspartate aminotransferase family protein [Solirubrobacteraceae bacterium]
MIGGADQLARAADAYLTPNYARFPVEFERGSGAKLWDSAGNEYLDFLSGISVSSVGHAHPAVVRAIAEQSARLLHVGNFFYTQPMSSLAQRLSECSLGPGSRVLFVNSGAEAVEAALKCARKARRGGRIVSLHGAFHGRTYGALSATPQESKQAPFAPLVPGFSSVPADADSLRAAVGPDVAAVLLEPIQGETGVHVLSAELLRAAREVCDESGAALVFDEIQTGLGRTGAAWAFQHPGGVVPDMLLSAKALGAGLPIGALICGPRYADVFEPGDHGSTFPGGPVVCAAAHAALDVLLDERLLERVRSLGERLRAGLEELPHVLSVRGRGLMIAFDVDLDAVEVVRRALVQQRLIVNATGPVTVRLLPPLIVDERDCDAALQRLEIVLREA